MEMLLNYYHVHLYQECRDLYQFVWQNLSCSVSSLPRRIIKGNLQVGGKQLGFKNVKAVHLLFSRTNSANLRTNLRASGKFIKSEEQARTGKLYCMIDDYSYISLYKTAKSIKKSCPTLVVVDELEVVDEVELLDRVELVRLKNLPR